MRLVIEERQPGRPAREEALLASYAAILGIPVVGMTWKPFVRKRVSPLPGDIVAGSIAFVRSALQSLGRQLPKPDPYPEALRPFLHRDVWLAGTVGEVLAQERTVFIKPAKRWKLFTGFVVDTPNPPQLYNVSRREPVWASTPVKFLSEYRVYVVEGRIRFVGFSDNGGDRDFYPDMRVVKKAVEAYTRAPLGYAIDFGVLSTGETALIEVNDGFSVGAYDNIPAADYYDMVVHRWFELSTL